MNTMQKTFILVACLLFSGLYVNAQNNKVVSAWNYLTQFDRDSDNEALIKAREAIDAALQHEKTKGNAKTWHYKGLIELKLAGSDAHKDASTESVELASEAFTKSLELDTKKRYKDDNVQNLGVLTTILGDQGIGHYDKKDFKNAYGSFKKIADINKIIKANSKKELPMDTSTLKNAALCAQKAELDDEAVEIYQELYDANIKEVGVLSSLGTLYKKMGNEEKSKAFRAEARELFPENQGLLIDEINEMLADEKQDQAIDLLTEAIANEPEKAEYHFVLGTAKDKMKDNAGARAAYEKAIELNAEYFDAYFNLGALYYNKAADITKKMQDLPLDAETEYEQMNKESGDLFKESLPFLEKAHSINKTDINTISALKEIYAKIGDFDKSNAMKALLGGDDE